VGVDCGDGGEDRGGGGGVRVAVGVDCGGGGERGRRTEAERAPVLWTPTIET
jgi:hypothetical protein